MNEDITFCDNRECKLMACERNQKHIKLHYIEHSFASFEGTKLCMKEFESYEGDDNNENA